MSTPHGKILGQMLLTDTLMNTLYTVPDGVFTSVSSIYICNISGSNKTIDIAISVGGEADSNKQFIYYQLDINQKDTFINTTGLTLGPGDKIRIRSTSGGSALAVNASGLEFY